jgi:hypothetical protein
LTARLKLLSLGEDALVVVDLEVLLDRYHRVIIRGTSYVVLPAVLGPVVH